MGLGLRNKEENKVELERTLVGEEIGLDERVNMQIGTSLSYPDKMEIAVDDVRNIRQKLEQANLEVDLDKIAICIDLDWARGEQSTTPPPCGLRGVHIHCNISSSADSERRSILCGPPLFHSGSHARRHGWPQKSCSSIR